MSPNTQPRHVEPDTDSTREHIENYLSVADCPTCEGTRLKPESRAVLVEGTAITEVNRMSIGDALSHFEGMEADLSERDLTIAEEILKEIRARLGFMVEVGLEYLTLDREASTLSGGESQRIRLATQVGTQLTGVLYVLDEPSIGLHPRDNNRLIQSLESLRDLGNSVLVVEHDRDMIESADHVVDLGFVPAGDKLDAYAAAALLCQPSVHESFSIVLLESWRAGTPVLVHSHCAVTVDHCRRSNGGLYFSNEDEFAATLDFMLNRPALAQKMGRQGREYVLANFSWDVIVEKYRALIRALDPDPARGSNPATGRR
jgi:ABC-type dipeptide/oligopeptide/nickel transport system ATPase component